MLHFSSEATIKVHINVDDEGNVTEGWITTTGPALTEDGWVWATEQEKMEVGG